jgi:polyferredoxin
MEGVQKLLQSRRFVTMAFAILVGLVLYFAGKYLLPSQFADVKFVIDLITPLAIGLIAAFTVDDAIQSIMAAQTEMHKNALAAQIAQAHKE